VDADEPPYKYDGEKILLFQDVFPENDTYFVDGLLSVPMRFNSFQTMVLINGKGAGIASTGITTPGVPCNETLSVINVLPGKCYRLRLIGGTALSFNIFAIEDHDDLQVIEADGYASLPGIALPLIPFIFPHRIAFLKPRLTKNELVHGEAQHSIYANRSRPTLQCSSLHQIQSRKTTVLLATRDSRIRQRRSLIRGY
jgi:Multicopper oxidase